MNRITKYSGGVAVIPKEKIKDAARQLAKYEDTGLTPEEIMDGKMLTGWIPVEERLPEDGKAVLATDSKYVYLVEYDADLDAPFGDLDVITAWMLLPKLYQVN